MENLQWLMENGGPALKLRMMNESMIDKDSYDSGKLAEELLQIEKVQMALTYFDKFKDFKSIPVNKRDAYVHNQYEECFEIFMPFFTRIGFRAGISAFDEKVEYMRDTYLHFMNLGKERKEISNHVGGLNIIGLLLEAGYYKNVFIDYMTERINKGHKITQMKDFNFFESNPDKIRTLPKIWRGKPVLKDLYSFISGEVPVPTRYFIMSMLYFYKYVTDKGIKKKADDIIEYILDPRYQRTRGYYGYIWLEDKQSYYSCTNSGLCLPLFETNTLLRNEKFSFLNKINLMSYSPIAKESEWFHKCIDLLEQYKAERGTYIFPDDFMQHHIFSPPASVTTIYKAFISQDANVKRNEKRAFVNELYSTFFMELMKKRMSIYPEIF